MRIVNYRAQGSWRAGAVIGGDIYDIGSALEEVDGCTVQQLLHARGGTLADVDTTVRTAITNGLRPVGALDEAEIGAPVNDPKKVLCIGLNYRDHVAETGRKLPEHPDVFTKFATSLIGPNDAIGGADVTEQLDFEGELAIIIGKTAKHVTAADALAHVAGVTVLNDITARDLQYRGTQWTMGKAVDASTPSGPELVTLDEVGDIQNLDLTTRVNGTQMQHSNTRNMIFPVAEIIAYLSRTITLEPGDIIATGTPEGIGSKRTPPVWLAPGDEVTVEIERVGNLRSVIGTPAI